VHGLLYLDRYWRQEQVIAGYVDAAALAPPAAPDPERLAEALARLFPDADADRQRLAAVVAAHRRFSILAGGPGTGKTTTVARILAVLQDLADGGLRIALAAPTGKAAARLTEAAGDAAASLPAEDRARLGALEASTLHRLLGFRPGARTRFWHDRDNRLPYDAVVVDEASMVDLTMMSRLVEALRADARLVLVGDPDQLASVEVGAVLGDLVERPAPDGAPSSGSAVVRLSRVHRFKEAIQELATAVRSGSPDQVLDVLSRGHAALDFVDAEPAAGLRLGELRADVVSSGEALVAAARSGDARTALEALDRHRLLCAHREGPYGVAGWGQRVEEWLGEQIAGYGRDGLWYVGRPLLVTANDYQLRLFNGDTGVVVDVDGQPVAAFRRDGEVVRVRTSRLSDVQTVHALSIHRSQGSQFDKVTVVLPPAESPLLTRELLYTAVTRAKEHVRIIGTSDALAAAVRRRIIRASGLGRR
jgi:exodeoxyribonuclease V alpha subunit